MTGEELEQIRMSLGYSQQQMAARLACDYVGYKRYATGARPVPSYIARCASLLAFIQSKGLLAECDALLTGSHWLLKLRQQNHLNRRSAMQSKTPVESEYTSAAVEEMTRAWEAVRRDYPEDDLIAAEQRLKDAFVSLNANPKAVISARWLVTAYSQLR